MAQAPAQFKPIDKFWSKLMVASKSINNIPNHFLAESKNARIYDWGIWPRRWKSLLTNSTLWSNNKGGFYMWGKLYQITNSKIYEINLTTGVQTEKATLWYDATTDVLVYWSNICIIASPWQALQVFNWTALSTPATVPASNTGILEYCRGYSFLASDNILYISRPITSANPAYAYDFTGSGSQNITFDTSIKALKATMNGIYIFCEDQVHMIWANSLQNVAWAATFISTPLWDSAFPISNFAVAASGDKIFYLTENLQIQTINYLWNVQQYSADTTIWELSARPVVSIKELLNTFDTVQPNMFAYYNENEKNIQFHLRSAWVGYNDTTLVYDLINDTWNIDTNKIYNYMVKIGTDYYGFSDLNSSVYKDWVWYSDAWVPIPFKIVSQNIIYWTTMEKLFQGFFTSGGIWFLTDLTYNVLIDGSNVFTDTISGSSYWIQSLWAIAEEPIAQYDIAGWPMYSVKLNPFDKVADAWRIFRNGIRINYEITSDSQYQDFIIDILGTIYSMTNFTSLNNKF